MMDDFNSVRPGMPEGQLGAERSAHHNLPVRFFPILHPLFEALAYAAGFAIYLALKKRYGDPIAPEQRLTVITAAAVGAAMGSKGLALLESPAATLAHWRDPLFIMGPLRELAMGNSRQLPVLS